MTTLLSMFTRYSSCPRWLPIKRFPDMSNVPNSNEMAEFDASGGYVVKASIDIADGNNAELKDRALVSCWYTKKRSSRRSI